MLREAFNSTVGFYKAVSGEFVMLLFTLLGGFIATYMDPLRLLGVIEPQFIWGIYTISTLVATAPIIFLINLFKQGIFRNRTYFKFKPIEGVWIDQATLGAVIFAGLQIENGSNEIEDCIATLEFVNNNNVPLKQNQWFGMYALDRLRWKNNRGPHDCQIRIPPGSREEVILVQHIKASARKEGIPIEHNFSYCDMLNRLPIPFGHYQITVRLNGKIDGKPITRYFRGFTHSEILGANIKGAQQIPIMKISEKPMKRETNKSDKKGKRLTK